MVDAKSRPARAQHDPTCTPYCGSLTLLMVDGSKHHSYPCFGRCHCFGRYHFCGRYLGVPQRLTRMLSAPTLQDKTPEPHFRYFFLLVASVPSEIGVNDVLQFSDDHLYLQQ